MQELLLADDGRCPVKHAWTNVDDEDVCLIWLVRGSESSEHSNRSHQMERHKGDGETDFVTASHIQQTMARLFQLQSFREALRGIDSTFGYCLRQASFIQGYHKVAVAPSESLRGLHQRETTVRCDQVK